MNKTNHKPGHWAGIINATGLVCLALAIVLNLTTGVAMAAPQAASAPGMGAAAAFSVLGKAGVTNTGPSVLSGNVGADSSIMGFPPGSAVGSVLAPAVNGPEADASTADLALTAQASAAASAGPNLTGVTLVPGVYDVGSALLPGQLTLDGPGVYVFLASALTVSGNVNMINGASACNVFWHVTSAATITGGSFAGTIIAGTSVTFGDAASLDGRAIALTGSVTLINNSISGPSCAAAPAATATQSTSVPSATKVSATSAPKTTAVPDILPVTGVDLTGGEALGSRQWIQFGLGLLGLSLLVLGFTLKRKH